MTIFKHFEAEINPLKDERTSDYGAFHKVARAVFPAELAPAPTDTDAALGVFVRVAKDLKNPPRDYLPTHVHPALRHMFFDWAVKTHSFPNGNALYDAYIYIKAPVQQILEDEDGNALIFNLVDHDGEVVEVIWNDGFKPSCVRKRHQLVRREPQAVAFFVEWILPVQPRSFAHRPACRFTQLPYTRVAKRFNVEVTL